MQDYENIVDFAGIELEMYLWDELAECSHLCSVVVREYLIDYDIEDFLFLVTPPFGDQREVDKHYDIYNEYKDIVEEVKRIVQLYD